MACGDPGVCDKVTGHCTGSCLPGWKGDMCQNGNNLYTILCITLGYLLFNVYIRFFILNSPMPSLIIHVRTNNDIIYNLFIFHVTNTF